MAQKRSLGPAGEGAFLVGSRWAPLHYRVIYTSRTLPLCVLESLVHMEVRHMKDNFVVFPIDISLDLAVETVETGRDHPELPEDQKPFQSISATLPRRWRDRAAWPKLQEISAGWIESGNTCLLRVPSAIIPRKRIS